MWAQDIGTAVIVCPLAYPGKHVPLLTTLLPYLQKALWASTNHDTSPILSTEEMLIDPKKAQLFRAFWACNGEKEY
jgi:hypothetical protein